MVYLVIWWYLYIDDLIGDVYFRWKSWSVIYMNEILWSFGDDDFLLILWNDELYLLSWLG